MSVLALAALLAGFAATGLLTRHVLAFLVARQIVDLPNARSSHSRPTPRGGGLAVTPVLLVLLLLLGLIGATPAGWRAVLAGTLALLALSWADDRRGLPARLRLMVHLLAVALGLSGLGDHLIFQGLLPWSLDRLAALGLWVWFLNLYNFMDGIDGITGTETAVIGLGLMLVSLITGDTTIAPMAAAAAGAGLGFLLWNWHPAKIFLGDSGSVPLGYLLGWLLLSMAGSGDWATALILPAYYLADASITLSRRALRGERIFEAHRQHFYQRALAQGASHAMVVRCILTGGLALGGLALFSPRYPCLTVLLAAAAVVATLWRLHRMGQGSSR